MSLNPIASQYQRVPLMSSKYSHFLLAKFAKLIYSFAKNVLIKTFPPFFENNIIFENVKLTS